MTGSKKKINQNWKFNYFPEGNLKEEIAKNNFRDTDWVPVAVPHTWNTYETTKELHPFIMNASERVDPYWWYGWGWYRKEIEIDSKYKNNKIFIEFDGVQKYTKLFLNGKLIGEHKGGYNSFCFDLTEHIIFDEKNTLAVAVSNRRDDHFGGIPPMTAGNFNVYGGIYRDVRIVIKDRLYIPFQGSAEHEGGTFVTTPEVSRKSAKVQVKTYIKNEYDNEKIITLKTKIFDKDEQLVTSMKSKVEVEPEEIKEVEQISKSISEPELWSPENPCLYTVVSEIIKENELLEAYKSPLGFRWFKWDYGEERLYLNGKKIHLHGTNRHQEYPWLGDAIPKWMHEMDLKDIKYNLGHNFLRTCHYPQDPYVYELCDKYGIIACEEVPNIKHLDFSDEVQKQNLLEMIRRDRNHPSILFWSMGNETKDAADPAWAVAEDETRIIHTRRARGRGSEVRHDHQQMEMENLLRCTIRGWYNSDVKDLEPENGQHTGHEEWQHDQALIADSSLRGRIDTNGAMWLYNDHGAERKYKNCPLLYINPKGWVDSYRVPKAIYYLWQANWSNKTVLHVHPYDWTAGYINQKRDIKVNSNCEYVELKMEGKSLGKKIPNQENNYTVIFAGVKVKDVPLIVEGKREGQYIKRKIEIPGQPHQISLTTEQEVITADRAGISLIKVDILDENKNHVFGAHNELRVNVSGAGYLVGPEIYYSDIDKNSQKEGTMYIDTPIYIPIRSTCNPGQIKIQVTSFALQADEITIKSVIPEKKDDTGIKEFPVQKNKTRKLEKKAGINYQNEKGIYALKETKEDIDFSSYPESEYRSRLAKLIKKRNKDIIIDQDILQILLKVMVEYLKKEEGILVADDYNFLINRYNMCCKYCKFDIFLNKRSEKKIDIASQIIEKGKNVDQL
ncbi:MAG: glycoside hydrolase family 2 TIM barrel-domain containing protein [Halanaerobiaceae bacterium]